MLRKVFETWSFNIYERFSSEHIISFNPYLLEFREQFSSNCSTVTTTSLYSYTGPFLSLDYLVLLYFKVQKMVCCWVFYHYIHIFLLLHWIILISGIKVISSMFLSSEGSFLLGGSTIAIHILFLCFIFLISRLMFIYIICFSSESSFLLGVSSITIHILFISVRRTVFFWLKIFYYYFTGPFLCPN